MADDLLKDILNYDPEDDPTLLLSRAYNEIERLRNPRKGELVNGRCVDLSRPSDKPCDTCGGKIGVRHFPDPECAGVHACYLCAACSGWTPAAHRLAELDD